MPRAASLLLVVVALAVTGCDQATKGWAEDRLAGAPPVEVVAGRVDLAYHENPGIAFSLDRVLPSAGRTTVVVLTGLALTAVLGVAWWRRRREVSPTTAGYALIAAGALGNLIDRFARGHVVDFIHVHGWPVFNVADVAIGVGAALLVLGAVRDGRRQVAGGSRPT